MSLLKIATIQTDLFWEDKASNLSMLSAKLHQLPATCQIVILPEMFSTGFTMNAASLAETMEGETIDWMRKMAKEHTVILTGSLIIKEDHQFYNRLIWMMPNGQMGHYDKRHLFGFAKEDQFYSSGNKRLIAAANGWKINLQICYDLRFPVWSRQQIKNIGNEEVPEYDVLVYVANWPEKRSLAWKSLLRARAIENQCYVIGVNRVGKDGNGHQYCGETSVIDPLGEVLYQKKDEEDIFIIELDKKILNNLRSQFPFLKDGDAFYIEN